MFFWFKWKFDSDLCCTSTLKVFGKLSDGVPKGVGGKLESSKGISCAPLSLIKIHLVFSKLTIVSYQVWKSGTGKSQLLRETKWQKTYSTLESKVDQDNCWEGQGRRDKYRPKGERLRVINMKCCVEVGYRFQISERHAKRQFSLSILSQRNSRLEGSSSTQTCT